MAEMLFRLPSNAPYGFVEVTLTDDDIQRNTPEETRALLQGALDDLNAVLPADAAPTASGGVPQQAAPRGGKDKVYASPSGRTETCEHGQREYKTGGPNAKGNYWKAFFCPQPKGSPSCSVIWVND